MTNLLKVPRDSFLREIDVQTELTNILFLYSVQNPSVGYRQGIIDVALRFDSHS